jgi:hypothetical protein
MNYRSLKIHEVEGLAWGLIVAVMLTVGGTPPAFALVVLDKPGYHTSNV